MIKMIAPEFQRTFNSSGSRFVRVNNRVYTTDNPQRYIATVKRRNPDKLFSQLYECDANGNKLTYK